MGLAKRSQPNLNATVNNVALTGTRKKLPTIANPATAADTMVNSKSSDNTANLSLVNKVRTAANGYFDPMNNQ